MRLRAQVEGVEPALATKAISPRYDTATAWGATPLGSGVPTALSLPVVGSLTYVEMLLSATFGTYANLGLKVNGAEFVGDTNAPMKTG